MDTPKCPYCGKALERVYENEYESYRFVPETGRYICVYENEEFEIVCPYCGAEITELFPDGVCNFQAE